jgi:C4-dicarboxylate-specific signal transduction histidine kinase
LQARIAGLVAANPDVHLLTLMDAQGTAVLSTAPEVVGGKYAFREYFKTAMAGKPNVTGIIVGAVQGRAGSYIAHPVLAADGTVVGVVALRLRAESIDAIVATAGGAERTPFLVDGDGVLIYHRDAALRFSSLAALAPKILEEIRADQRFRRDRIASLDMPALAQAMVGARNEGTIDYVSTVSHAAEVAGFAPVAGHDWVVGVTETRDSFEAPLREMLYRVLYALLLVGLVFVLLALLFARSIVRPIRQLTAAADALKRGDYDAAHVRVTSQDEVGALGRTFNVMIDVLRQRERERRLRSGEHSGG